MPGETIFEEFFPAAPDTAVALFSTGGFPQDGPLAQPTFQVRVRAFDPPTAYGLLEQVYDLLHGFHHQSLEDLWLLDCAGVQSAPVLLGRDAAGRTEYSMNFRCSLRKRV